MFYSYNKNWTKESKRPSSIILHNTVPSSVSSTSMTAPSVNRNSKKDQSDLPLVPEHVLKRRHDLDDLARRRAAQPAKKREKRVIGEKKAVYVRKPETILAQAKNKRNHAVRYKRVKNKGMQKRASNKKEFETKQVEDAEGGNETKIVTFQKNSVGAKLVFCVRIRGPVAMPEQVRKVLTQFRLRNIHEGVFLRYDESTRKMLHLVEPWVVYGPPPAAVITDLLERRGHGKVNKERVPLADNTLIENALGKYNIVCKEDLIYEIVNVGENFKEANHFLWPFILADPKSRFERKTLKLKDGKEYGDRGEAIVEYIREVL
jgi:large subunit ribosomal protein L7e